MFLPILLFFLVLFLFVHGALAQECDQCFFTAEDVEDCRVYGKIDRELFSWAKASEDCLDAYSLRNSGIVPFSVGCDPRNVNTFVNSGLSGGAIPNTVLPGLGVEEGGFFEEQQGTGVYRLKDSITVNGESFDCQASQSNCYNAMKEYFAIGAAGEGEMDDVCCTILNKVALDNEIEQSDARNRVCQDLKEGTIPPSACGTLIDEVQTAIDAAPDKICAGFAFGSDTTVAPGCEGQVAGCAIGTSESDTRRSISFTFAMLVAGMMSVRLTRT